MKTYHEEIKEVACARIVGHLAVQVDRPEERVSVGSGSARQALRRWIRECNQVDRAMTEDALLV